MNTSNTDGTTERIYNYTDGSVYMGHMCENTCVGEGVDNVVTYLRHGRGTLRTPSFVYGIPLNNYTSEEAAENDYVAAKWHEYAGTWKNDKLHGYGVHVQKFGNGREIVIFEGEWNNGKPFKSVHANDDNDTVFG